MSKERELTRLRLHRLNLPSAPASSPVAEHVSLITTRNTIGMVQAPVVGRDTPRLAARPPPVGGRCTMSLAARSQRTRRSPLLFLVDGVSAEAGGSFLPLSDLRLFHYQAAADVARPETQFEHAIVAAVDSGTNAANRLYCFATVYTIKADVVDCGGRGQGGMHGPIGRSQGLRAHSA